MSSARVSGTVLRANRAAFAKLVGEEKLSAVFRDPRFRFWDEVTNLGWIEVGVVEESVRALARAAGRDPDELNAAATRIGTEQSFRSVWRILLRFTSDEALLARAQIFYARVFDTGRIVYEPADHARSSLRLVGWDDPPRFHMLGLAAGIETMLQLTGRKQASVVYEVVGGEHLFRTTT